MKNKIVNLPSADILMYSMRSIGYSFEASIADIVDNSISARATKIDIEFPPNRENLYLSIFDNGHGMTREELINALKYGSKHIGEKRNFDDLGRFGLGLKSASLSHCKILTVISKKNGLINALQWDLDHVSRVKQWELIELSEESIKKTPSFWKLQNTKSGTIVLWENFDTLDITGDDLVYRELIGKIDVTENHLALIFHRFLNGQSTQKIEISINERKIIGLEPFLESNKKTDIKKQQTIALKIDQTEDLIKVQPVILPFQKDLSKKDIEKLGGFEDLRSNQGFYIYRQNRLIVWGTWFKMNLKNELNKYARVKVDIPNTLDDVWKIDIKKQSATLPRSLRVQLKNIVDNTISISRRKNKHRAVLIDNDENKHIWKRLKDRDGRFIYEINQESYLIEALKEEFDEDHFNMFLEVLEVIQLSIPYQDIYSDVSGRKISEEIDKDKINSLIKQVDFILENQNADKTQLKKVKQYLINQHPFNHPIIVDYINRR